MKYSYTLAIGLALNISLPNASLAATAAAKPHTSAPVHRAQPAPQASSNVSDYYGEIPGQTFTWPASKMPLRVYIHPAEGVAAYKPEFRQILESCFSEWSEATDGRLKFAFMDKPEEADMQFQFLRNLPKGAIAHEIGITEFQKGIGGIEKTKTTLLTVNTDGHPMLGFNMRQAALHEVGHAIGIQGHSVHPPDVMTLNYHFILRKNQDGSVTPVNGDPHLTSRDKNTIARLYDAGWLASSGMQSPTVDPVASGSPQSDPFRTGSLAPGNTPVVTPQVASADTAPVKPLVATAARATAPPAPKIDPIAVIPQVAALNVHFDQGASSFPTPKIDPAAAAPAPVAVSQADPIATAPAPTTIGAPPAVPATADTAPASTPPIQIASASPAAAPPEPSLSMLPVENAPQAAPGQYVSLVRSGIDGIKRGDFDSAISVLDQASKLADSSKIAEKNLIIALTWKANKLYQAHDYANCAESYKTALSLRLKLNGASDPKIAETLPAFFYCLRKSGRESEINQWKWLAR